MKHGMSRTRLYQCWSDMKQRCLNPNNSFYYRYGGRGIKFCDEWRDFTSFMEWALSNGYSDDLTLDRIDNDGNYCPENCKWSTQREQSLNKTHLIGVCGVKGVRKCSTHKGKYQGYKATICENGKEKYLGYSKTIEGAAEIRRRYIEQNMHSGGQPPKAREA